MTLTWQQLWEAGWVANPRCHWPLPTEVGLLQELREIGDGAWTCYGDCGCPRGCDAILQAVYVREGGRGRGHLRRRTTKADGVMWGWKV